MQDGTWSDKFFNAIILTDRKENACWQWVNHTNFTGHFNNDITLHFKTITKCLQKSSIVFINYCKSSSYSNKLTFMLQSADGTLQNCNSI